MWGLFVCLLVLYKSHPDLFIPGYKIAATFLQLCWVFKKGCTGKLPDTNVFSFFLQKQRGMNPCDSSLAYCSGRSYIVPSLYHLPGNGLCWCGSWQEFWNHSCGHGKQQELIQHMLGSHPQVALATWPIPELSPPGFPISTSESCNPTSPATRRSCTIACKVTILNPTLIMWNLI